MNRSSEGVARVQQDLVGLMADRSASHDFGGLARVRGSPLRASHVAAERVRVHPTREEGVGRGSRLRLEELKVEEAWKVVDEARAFVKVPFQVDLVALGNGEMGEEHEH
jgi:hypothetical protein